MASPSTVVGQGAWGRVSGELARCAVCTACTPCGGGGPGRAGKGQAWQCWLKEHLCNSRPSPPQAVGGTLSPPQQPRVLSCRRSQVIEKFEALDIEKAEHMETNSSAGPSPSSDTRQGRSEKRAFPRKRVSAWGPGPVLRPRQCHVRPRGHSQHVAPHLLTDPPQTHLDTLLLGFPLSFPSCLLVSLLSSSE